MNEHGGIPYLREVILFMALAGILIPLLKRYRINQILGFLTIGALLGPHGPGSLLSKDSVFQWLIFPQLEIINIFAEVGVIFLMFTIGLHLSLERLWSMRKWVFGVGVLQMIITTVVIGSILQGVDYSSKFSFVIGALLSFSSTAIVVQLLQQYHEMTTPTGRGVFSVLLLQDLAVVPVILLVEALAGHSLEANVIAFQMIYAMGKATLAICVIYFLGKKVLRPIFNAFADTKEPESFMALVLLTTLGIAGMTYAAGLSMALGALLAGLMLAETQFRYEIEVLIKPFGGLLLGLFFFSMGMNIDLTEAIERPFWLFGLLAVVYVIKAVIVGILLRLFGLSRRAAIEGAVLLGQGSEFAFIVVGIAVAKGMVGKVESDFLILLLSLSLFVTPLLYALTRMMRQFFENRIKVPEHDHPEPPSNIKGHAVLLGYGRMGQVLGKILYQNNIPFVAIDSNARHSAFFHKHGMPVYYANEQNPEILRKFNVDRSVCVVLTMNNPHASLQVVEAIRRDYPSVAIFARAHDESHAKKLIEAGVNEVILETFEASLQLTQAILRHNGLSLEQLQAIVQKERDIRIADMMPLGK